MQIMNLVCVWSEQDSARLTRASGEINSKLCRDYNIMHAFADIGVEKHIK